MRFECYGESLTLESGRVDGDTFLVDCEETPPIALCDSSRDMTVVALQRIE